MDSLENKLIDWADEDDTLWVIGKHLGILDTNQPYHVVLSKNPTSEGLKRILTHLVSIGRLEEKSGQFRSNPDYQPPCSEPKSPETNAALEEAVNAYYLKEGHSKKLRGALFQIVETLDPFLAAVLKEDPREACRIIEERQK